MDDPNEAHMRGLTRALRVRNRSPRTIQSYLESAQQLADYHHGRDLAQLDRADIETYLADLLDVRKPTTVAVRYRSIQQLYKWMTDEGIIDSSPMTGMHPPTVQEQPVPILADEQIRALLRACDGRGFTERRDTAIIRTFLEAGGPRLSELANLTIEDVDLQQDVIYLLGKGDRPRAIPFGAKTGQALERYLRERAKHPAALSPALWLGLRMVPMTASGVTQMLRRRAKQAGIPHLHPHMLRHTAAHVWMASGGSEVDAMRLFGWRSRQMLARYGASAADERAREAARKLRLGDRF